MSDWKLIDIVRRTYVNTEVEPEEIQEFITFYYYTIVDKCILIKSETTIFEYYEDKTKKDEINKVFIIPIKVLLKLAEEVKKEIKND